LADETPQERRERYFRHAREAEELAAHSRNPEIRAAFLRVAISWKNLAKEIKDEPSR
jgi:hypothetical protein